MIKGNLQYQFMSKNRILLFIVTLKEAILPIATAQQSRVILRIIETTGPPQIPGRLILICHCFDAGN